MASSPKFDDITRVLDLIAKPLVLEILDGLGQGLPLHGIPVSDAPGDLVDGAVEYLRSEGAVTFVGEVPDARHPVLTPLGRRLFGVLEQASQIGESGGTAGAHP